MAASVLTPVTVALTTTLQDLTVSTPASKVRAYAVRFANVGAADAYGDLVMTDGTTVINRAKNFPVLYQSSGSAPDMEERIVVPAGWKLRAKASANSTVEASVINGVEADVADFA